MTPCLMRRVRLFHPHLVGNPSSHAISQSSLLSSVWHRDVLREGLCDQSASLELCGFSKVWLASSLYSAVQTTLTLLFSALTQNPDTEPSGEDAITQDKGCEAHASESGRFGPVS
jgi:hypothetical protein